MIKIDSEVDKLMLLITSQRQFHCNEHGTKMWVTSQALFDSFAFRSPQLKDLDFLPQNITYLIYIKPKSICNQKNLQDISECEFVSAPEGQRQVAHTK